MSFVHGELLVLLAIPPLLLLCFAHGARRRRALLNQFATPYSLEHIAPDARLSSRGRRTQAALTVIAVALCVLALAGPRYGSRWETIERRGIDLVVVIDCSRSMLAEDISPSRMERAKRELLDLMDLVQDDRIALVPFAGTAFVQCPLTLDHRVLPVFLETLGPDLLPVGGSDIDAALRVAASAFDPKSPAARALILITDGENTGPDPAGAAQALAEEGITLFALGVGGDLPVPIPLSNGSLVRDKDGRRVLTRLDLGGLQRLTGRSGGSAVRSQPGDDDLKRIYHGEIRARMDPVELTGGRRRVPRDRYQWFLTAALLLLLSAGLVPKQRRRAGAAARRAAAALVLVCFGLASAPSAVPAGSLERALEEGFAAYRRGDFAEAVRRFSEARQEAPQRPEIAYNLGNAAYRAGDFEEASRRYQEALATASPDLRQKAHYNLGNTRLLQDRPEDALEHYRAALQLDPDDPEARANLALAEQLLQRRSARNEAGAGGNAETHGARRQQTPFGGPRAEPPGRPSSQPGDGVESFAPNAASSGAQEPARERSGRSSTDFGRELQAPAATASPPAATGSDQPPAAPAATGTDSPGAAQPVAAAATASSSGRLSPLLNRLRDRPGAAARPHYAKRWVEKDW